MFVGASDTAPLPFGGAGKDAFVHRRFAVGFKPHGGETALFRGLMDFSFRPAQRALVAAKRRIQKEKNRGAVALLESWLSVKGEEDAEHRETLEYLVKAIDEDRSSYRKLFP